MLILVHKIYYFDVTNEPSLFVFWNQTNIKLFETLNIFYAESIIHPISFWQNFLKSWACLDFYECHFFECRSSPLLVVLVDIVHSYMLITFRHSYSNDVVVDAFSIIVRPLSKIIPSYSLENTTLRGLMNKQITPMNAMHSFCMSYHIGPPFTTKLTKTELENVCNGGICNIKTDCFGAV